MVLGEPQILGQVKQAYAAARTVGAVQSSLERLLQTTFTVAKRVRTETQIGSASVSIASVAVDLAKKIFGSLDGKTVLLVGAGKMSELAARHLIQQGAHSMMIANRTFDRAVHLAQTFRGRAVRFEDLHAVADQADILITSTGAAQPIFRREHAQQFLHRRRNRPMFYIDIAVPRDVAPEVNRLEGAFVYDIDDLQSVAASHISERSKEAMQAEAIVQAEVERFATGQQTLSAVPAIVSLQQIDGRAAAGGAPADAGQAAVAFGGAAERRRGTDARADQQGAAPAAAGDESGGEQRRPEGGGSGAADIWVVRAGRSRHLIIPSAARLLFVIPIEAK